MSNTETNEGKRPSWDRILELLEQDLAERRDTKLVVEALCETGSYHKEIGELSVTELQGLDPALEERVEEQLLDRYLAEQGYVDLVEKRRAYTKKIEDLIPEDLPALIQAERYEVEEHRKEREREEFVREARKDLERLRVLELAEV